MKGYLPHNLDLDRLIAEFPPNEVARFKKDKLIYIISQLFAVPAYRELNDWNNGFVNLKAKYLQKKVRNYRQYLDYLIRVSVIESDNQYIFVNGK